MNRRSRFTRPRLEPLERRDNPTTPCIGTTVHSGDPTLIQTRYRYSFNSAASIGPVVAIPHANYTPGVSDEVFSIVKVGGTGDALRDGDNFMLKTRTGYWLNSFDSRGDLTAVTGFDNRPAVSDEVFTIHKVNDTYDPVIHSSDQVMMTTRYGYYINSAASQGKVSAIPTASFDPQSSDEIFSLFGIPNGTMHNDDDKSVAVDIAGDPSDIRGNGSGAGDLGAIDVSKHVCGEIKNVDDIDFYKFTAEAGQIITFDVDADANLNPYLKIFGATGGAIAYNDNRRSEEPNDQLSSRTSDSFIHYTFRESGTYFAAVSSYAYDVYNPDSYDGRTDHTNGNRKVTGFYTLTLRTPNIQMLSASVADSPSNPRNLLLTVTFDVQETKLCSPPALALGIYGPDGSSTIVGMRQTDINSGHIEDIGVHVAQVEIPKQSITKVEIDPANSGTLAPGQDASRGKYLESNETDNSYFVNYSVLPPPEPGPVPEPTPPTIVIPKISVSPTSVDFPATVWRHTETRSITVTNVGDPGSTLTVTGNSWANLGSSFRIQPDQFPFQLRSGQSQNLEVVFTPMPGTSGPISDTLLLESDDPAQPSVGISISATASRAMPTELLGTRFESSKNPSYLLLRMTFGSTSGDITDLAGIHFKELLNYEPVHRAGVFNFYYPPFPWDRSLKSRQETPTSYQTGTADFDIQLEPSSNSDFFVDGHGPFDFDEKEFKRHPVVASFTVHQKYQFELAGTNDWIDSPSRFDITRVVRPREVREGKRTRVFWEEVVTWEDVLSKASTSKVVAIRLQTATQHSRPASKHH